MSGMWRWRPSVVTGWLWRQGAWASTQICGSMDSGGMLTLGQISGKEPLPPVRIQRRYKEKDRGGKGYR